VPTVPMWSSNLSRCRSSLLDRRPGRLLQGGKTRRPAPLRAPGKRSQLIPCRSRDKYGCRWATYARRTDAPVITRPTRITMTELAATNRWARFPASRCGGALPHRAGRRVFPPCSSKRHLQRAPRSPRPRTRVTREAVTRARSVTAALGWGPNADGRRPCGGRSVSTRRPREQERGAWCRWQTALI
jgi:hypothetical protein